MLLATVSLTGCHGGDARRDFEMPESFDESRDYEVVFWAKNDTNKTQTEIYQRCVDEFESLYPNIHINLKLYTDYSTIYNDVITNADMRNTFSGLILPSVMSVFYVYLLRENFSQVPDQLYYAAKVDGTSDLKYLFRVMLPICRPTVVTITILKVIECWNSYVWPRLITDDKNYFLVSNGIQEIRQNGFGRENIPAMMAAVVVISLPLIILFLIFRRQIMAGVSRGGTKG